MLTPLRNAQTWLQERNASQSVEDQLQESGLVIESDESLHDDHPDILIREGIAIIFFGSIRGILTKHSLKLILQDRCDDRMPELIETHLEKEEDIKEKE